MIGWQPDQELLVEPFNRELRRSYAAALGDQEQWDQALSASLYQRERLVSYLDSWSSVHAANPEDTEAALFHALSLLANAPAEDKSYARQIEAGEMLEGVLGHAFHFEMSEGGSHVMHDNIDWGPALDIDSAGIGAGGPAAGQSSEPGSSR